MFFSVSWPDGSAHTHEHSQQASADMLTDMDNGDQDTSDTNEPHYSGRGPAAAEYEHSGEHESRPRGGRLTSEKDATADHNTQATTRLALEGNQQQHADHQQHQHRHQHNNNHHHNNNNNRESSQAPGPPSAPGVSRPSSRDDGRRRQSPDKALPVAFSNSVHLFNAAVLTLSAAIMALLRRDIQQYV
jgi:hypothetical protein